MTTTLDNYPTVAVGNSVFTVVITPNAAPVFDTALADNLTIEKPQSLTPWSYVFPSQSDAEGNTITLNVLDYPAFMSFDGI